MKYYFDNAIRGEARASSVLGAKGKQLKSQLKMNVFISLAPFPAKREGKMCCVCARTSDERNEGEETRKETEGKRARAQTPGPFVAETRQTRGLVEREGRGGYEGEEG